MGKRQFAIALRLRGKSGLRQPPRSAGGKSPSFHIFAQSFSASVLRDQRGEAAGAAPPPARANLSFPAPRPSAPAPGRCARTSPVAASMSGYEHDAAILVLPLVRQELLELLRPGRRRRTERACARFLLMPASARVGRRTMFRRGIWHPAYFRSTLARGAAVDADHRLLRRHQLAQPPLGADADLRRHRSPSAGPSPAWRRRGRHRHGRRSPSTSSTALAAATARQATS